MSDQDVFFERGEHFRATYDEDKIPAREVTHKPKLRADIHAYIQESWAEFGRRAIARNDYVFIRTEAPKMSTEGGILLPSTLAGFYGGLPRGRFAYATVLSAGPKCVSVADGDVVLFPRGRFAREMELKDGSLIGWLREDVIEAKIDEIA